MRKYIKFDENERYEYHACSDGYVLRVSKKTFAEQRVKIFMFRGAASVKVNYKRLYLHTVIARVFLKDYFPKCIIKHKDGNPLHCSADNLYIFKGRHGGGRNQPVVITFMDGKREEFPSVKEAAKVLFVSAGTLSNFLNGKYKSSVLDSQMLKAERIPRRVYYERS